MRSIEQCTFIGAALLLSTSAAIAAPPALAAHAAQDGLVFALDRGQAEVRWELGEDGALAAWMTLEHPVLQIGRLQTATPAPAEPPPPLGEAARDIAPLPVAIDHLNIVDGELRWSSDEGPALRVHGLAMTIENFSTDRARSQGLPMLITGRGRIGRDGRCALFAAVNLWTGRLDFAGRAQITGLRLEELSGVVERRTHLRLTSGTLAVFVEFSVHDGQLTGGVRPLLTDADVDAQSSEWLGELEDWVASAAIEVFSRDVGRRERLAATIPLEGPLQAPQAPLWTALWTVVENAFFDAISAGYGALPPEAR